jgi:integrase/recombinase XerD
MYGQGTEGEINAAQEGLREGLRAWLGERAGTNIEPLFVSNRGGRLSRDAVERIVRKHVDTASRRCPTLKGKRVTPHVLRHSAAMQLLQNGVDRTVIALWLGHESVETTQMYVHADIQLKEEAMAKTKPMAAPAGRYRPSDELLTFLEAL